MPVRPATDQLYLHLHAAAAARAYALLAEVVRVKEEADGYGVAARFPGRAVRAGPR